MDSIDKIIQDKNGKLNVENQIHTNDTTENRFLKLRIHPFFNLFSFYMKLF